MTVIRKVQSGLLLAFLMSLFAGFIGLAAAQQPPPPDLNQPIPTFPSACGGTYRDQREYWTYQYYLREFQQKGRNEQVVLQEVLLALGVTWDGTPPSIRMGSTALTPWGAGIYDLRVNIQSPVSVVWPTGTYGDIATYFDYTQLSGFKSNPGGGYATNFRVNTKKFPSSTLYVYPSLQGDNALSFCETINPRPTPTAGPSNTPTQTRTATTIPTPRPTRSPIGGQCTFEGGIVSAIDVSGSQSAQDIAAEKNAAMDLAELMGLGTNSSLSMGAVSFDNIVRGEVPATSSLEEYRSGVANLPVTYGGTSIGTGLERAAVLLAWTVGDKAVIVLTDGQSGTIAFDMEQADRLRAQGARVFAIGYGYYNLSQLSDIAAVNHPDPNLRGEVFGIRESGDIASVIAGKLSPTLCNLPTAMPVPSEVARPTTPVLTPAVEVHLPLIRRPGQSEVQPTATPQPTPTAGIAAPCTPLFEEIQYRTVREFGEVFARIQVYLQKGVYLVAASCQNPSWTEVDDAMVINNAAPGDTFYRDYNICRSTSDCGVQRRDPYEIAIPADGWYSFDLRDNRGNNIGSSTDIVLIKQ
jgi:von Willebrand factor type A domain